MNKINKTNHQAILLIGPTGVGKTPLGEFLAREGLWDKRCVHFDFGENLRRVAKKGEPTHFLNQDDVNLIIRRLEENSLFENNELYIAKGTLYSFIEEQGVGLDDLIILNGIPRHTGQADYLNRLVDIKRIIYLEACLEVVTERIRLNSGGDRLGRVDDSLELIKKRLKIFWQRTMPVVKYYQNKKVGVQKIKVNINSRPIDIKKQIIKF